MILLEIVAGAMILSWVVWVGLFVAIFIFASLEK